MKPAIPRIAADKLTVSVPDRVLVDQLDAEFFAGDFIAILGKNGAGKSLLLRTLAGLRDATDGGIAVDGNALGELTRREVAKRVAWLPQTTEDVFPCTVYETALMGRHPHIEMLGVPAQNDHTIARAALAELGIEDLARRDIGTLSGGERRRLTIAQTLAQTPQTFLLDEPSNHLDPRHQLSVCELFAKRAEQGATVVAVLHDVNLASRFATRALLLFGDGAWHLGNRSDVLTAENLSALFGVEIETIAWRNRELFVAAGADEPSA